MSKEEAQDKFLAVSAEFPISYSSYYVLRNWGEQDGGGGKQEELLCVVNYNGVYFIDNSKKGKDMTKIAFEDLLYVQGSWKTLKIAYIARVKERNQDRRHVFHTEYARAAAEDIVAYCQIKLLETT